MSPSKKKICVVSISLGKGGAERSTALLTKMLSSLGHEVHLVLLNDIIDYEYEGQLFNLGASKQGKDSKLKQAQRLLAFKKFLREQKFDFIIDNRNRQFAAKEFIYSKFIYRAEKVIYVVRSYNLDQYFPKNKLVRKIMANSAVAIVGVSKTIRDELNLQFGFKKAQHIYNPFQVSVNKTEADLGSNSSYILFLGRIVDQVKNLELLLQAYLLSDLPKNGVQLRIYGDGPDLEWLENRILQLSLEGKVVRQDFTPEVEPVLKGAKFLVLSSYYEGFPRVLLEALAVETPVISVDCKSGPNEIIDNEQNGLLVENHSPEALANAMNRMIFDKDLYQKCKENAKSSVTHLDPTIIAKEWQKLLSQL